MAVYELQGPSVRESDIVLRGVEFTSPTVRLKSTSDFVKIQPGLRLSGNTDIIGTISQASAEIPAGKSISILDERHVNRRLQKDMTGMVRITTNGSPDTLVGASVTFHLSRVGSRAGAEAPLIGGAPSADPAARSLVDQINQAGIGDYSYSVQLLDPTPTATQTAVAVYEDNDGSIQTVSSTTNVDGNVSITVLATSGKTTYVHVVATVMMVTTSSTGRGFLSIGDGTTDHNEIEDFATASQEQPAATSLTDTITADTTYTVRLKKTAAQANVNVEDQTITAMAITV